MGGRKLLLVCIAAVLLGQALRADAKPIFKVGIVTDTHVGSCFTRDASRVRQAAELFKRENVDAIVNVGDICDRHEPKFYEAYRRAVDEVFPPEKPHPLEYFVYAFHDAFAYKGHARNQATRDQHEAFADVRKYLRAANPPEFETTICGYPMVFIRQFHEAEQLEEMIARAERAFPGKPVFVFSHVPPFNTTSGNGSVDDRKMLNRHPRVIQISGHTHGTLLNERNIWQGEFTAVNAGCLQVWGKDRIHNYGALVMEVCEDAVMFRRYDVRDGHEIGADEPWCVPLPFDPATAPFRLERRRAVSVAPEFPSGAELKVAYDEEGKVMVSLPSVEGMPRAFCYRIRATRRTVDGSQILFNAQPVGDFYLAPLERKGDVVQSFPEGWLDADERATVTVTPVNFFDKAGRALSTEIVGRPRDARCVFDCPSPMQKMTICHEDGTEGFELKDGFWSGQRGLKGRLMLPTEFVRGKEPVRVILDLHTSTPVGECFRAQVCGADSPWNRGLSNTLAIESGADVSSRVVLEYVPKVDVGEQCVYFYLLGDGKCRVRFDRVRIERPSPEKKGT